jgi:hypothetical protein
MPVQTRSQIRKIVTGEVIRSSIAMEKESHKAKENVNSLIWFVSYCRKTLDNANSTKAGMERLRLINELFFVIDEYFYDVMCKQRVNDSYLRFACVLYNKALEFYCDTEKLMEKFIGNDEIDSFCDVEESPKKNVLVEKKFVENFVKTMGKILTNFDNTFLELNLRKIYGKTNDEVVLKELRRAEEHEEFEIY